MSHGTLGEALAELEASLFVGREQELGFFRSWLTSHQSPVGIVHVWGPGGSGKSALLRVFARIAKTSGRELVYVDGQDIYADAGALAGALGASTLDTAVAQLNARHAVVLIDAFELLVDLTRVLQREVLPRLTNDVRLVVAGRHPLGLAWGAWRHILREMPLTALTSAEVREYLHRRDIHDPGLVEQTVAATGGLPLALTLASDLILQHHLRDLRAAPEWHRLVRSLVEQLLADIADPVLRELLEAGAVLRHFDEAMLAAVTARDDDIGAAFGKLCQLSIVRPGSHGLTLHDDVRTILSQDLRWRQPQRHTTLRLRALDAYRARMRTASAAEREWLLGERLALWENAFAQAMLFTETEVGRIWLDWGRPEDHTELMRVWSDWVDCWLATQMRLHVDREVDRAAMEGLFRHADTRIRVARDADNRLVGFSTAVPVCSETLRLIDDTPGLKPTLHSFLAHSRGQLPGRAAESNIHFFVNLAHDESDPVATQQALVRDVFGLFARGGTYLVATPIPAYKQLFQALGFRSLPEAHSWFWSDEQPEDGFVLDLTHVGFEAWIDAIVAGRQPPRTLELREIEQLLAEDVLPSWREDERLAASPLASYVLQHQGPTAERAQQLRRVLERALARRLDHADAERARALRALQAAYLHKRVSYERAAEELGVSRSTFYRLLHRGAHELAIALETMRTEDETT